TPGTPCIHQNGNGARWRVVPRGTLHRILPPARSTASRVPQGGAVQGTPRGDSIRPVATQYGVPICGEAATPSHCARGTSFTEAGTRMVTTTMMPLSGSMAGDPQLLP